MRILALVLFLTAAAWGADIPAGKRELLEQFFTLARMQERFEVGQLAGFKAGFEMAAPQIDAAQKAKIFAAAEQVLREKMDFARFKEQMFELYDRLVGEAELRAFITVLSTPEGRTMVETELRLIEPSMKVGMEMGRAIVPDLTRAVQEAMGEP